MVKALLERVSETVAQDAAPPPSPPASPTPATDDVPPMPPVPLAWDWREMETAPRDRPIYMTSDPDADRDGVLAYWRRTRVKLRGHKGWQPAEYWAQVLNHRPLEAEPFCWREAMARGTA